MKVGVGGAEVEVLEVANRKTDWVVLIGESVLHNINHTARVRPIYNIYRS